MEKDRDVQDLVGDLLGSDRLRERDRAGHVCPFLTREHIQRGLQSGRYAITGIGLERKCSRCGEYWPADTEFFYFQPSASGGLNCYCHDCYRSVTGRQPGQRVHDSEAD